MPEPPEHSTEFQFGYLLSAARWAVAHPERSFLAIRLREIEDWQAEHRTCGQVEIAKEVAP